ncbi:hypothetical protein AVEN_189155-1 [Araneus ventricosus]|uniref:Uncharacterized protein n=1 Tax=Araneus ventricosus TaxID=182803 RepID=A0A4Y2NKV1_ARAVE|nr:hypothetical protein AVEN_189155-1 [Araneus ventricosus]
MVGPGAGSLRQYFAPGAESTLGSPEYHQMLRNQSILPRFRSADREEKTNFFRTMRTSDLVPWTLPPDCPPNAKPSRTRVQSAATLPEHRVNTCPVPAIQLCGFDGKEDRDNPIRSDEA